MINRNLDDELFEATDARLNIAMKLYKARNNPFSGDQEISIEGILLAMLGASIEEAQERFVRVYNFRCHEVDERERK